MASRGTWNIEKYVGASFTSDGTIYRPNESTQVNLTSTQVKSRLANGSNAFFLPSTVYVKEPITFIWLEILNSDAFRAKIETYITSGDYLRITTHLSETYTGRFISVSRIWLSGVADTYDLQAIFERQA